MSTAEVEPVLEGSVLTIRKCVQLTAVAGLVLTTVIGVRGQGGTPAPILVVLNSAAPNPFGAYLPEILRAEGINSFDVVQLSALDAPTLGAAHLAILAETPLTAPQATLFTNYVAGGGRLVAMRPDVQLDGILGITRPVAAPVTNGYVLVDQSGPGTGLQNVTLPFKGAADRYDGAGATTVATLYTSSSLSDSRPAVVRHTRTAAWAFDLARSTAYTRQGDPALAGTDRDGDGLVRTGDVFYQNIDLSRTGIPHADVQMRLFSRVVADLLSDAGPLPRLWYFPGAARTILVPTADSHVSTPSAFTSLLASVENAGGHLSFYLSPFLDLSGLSVPDWVANGHDVGMHPYFIDFPPPADTFPDGYNQTAQWFFDEGLAPGATERHHQIEWGGWVDPLAAMQAHGVRMDLSYYTWGRPMFNPTRTSQAHGYITGSGLPMRFVGTTGQVLPVYQQVTALVDEQLVIPDPVHSQQLTPPQAVGVSRSTIDASQAGGYSAIATQFHVDYYEFGEVGPWVDGTLAYARSKQVPIWTAGRWLGYTEARAATTITGTSWIPGTGTLSFTIAVPESTDAQTLRLPQSFDGSLLAHVTVDGQTAATTLVTVNGEPTRMFSVAAAAGGAPRAVTAQYLAPGALPSISIGDTSIAEGDAGSADATLTVSLTGPAHANEVAVQYATSNGTAVAGADYTAATGTLIFPVGTNSLPLPIGVLGDIAFEPAETVAVTLSNATGAIIGDGSGVITITNNDPEPILFTDTTAADFSVCSVHTGTRAAAGGDVRLLGTFRDEFNAATFDPRWVAGNPLGPGVIPTPSAGLVQLADPSGAFLRSAVEIPATSVDVRASFTAGAFQSIGFADVGFATQYARFSTEGGSSLWAITNPGSGPLSTDLGPIPSGFHDFTIERVVQAFDETVRYRIDGVVVAEHTMLAGELPLPLILFLSNRGDGSNALTIDRVETDPSFAIGAGTFESCVVDALEVMAWKNLTWDALVPAGTTLAVSTRTSISNPDPASAAGWSAWSAPLAASGAAITSPPGRYLQYRLALATTAAGSSPIVGSVAAEAIGPATPFVSIAPVSAAENAGTAAFVVSLSWPRPTPVTLSYATSGGTATTGVDFAAASGPITFVAGDVSEVVSVSVIDDLLVESAETFTVTLSAPSGATIAVPQATGTIVDDDALPAAAADSYATPFESALTVPAPGVLGNDDARGAPGLVAVLVNGVAHGTLTLGSNGSVLYTPDAGFVGTDTFTYRADSDAGAGTTASVTIAVGEPTIVQPPQELRVSAMSGNVVTFRWKTAGIGPVPTGFLIEGGALPSQTLAAVPTGHRFPIFTVTVPSGSFYVRVRALGTGGPSEPSNEIRVHVGVPVAPSAPAGLSATASGNSLHLAWTSTFAGGQPVTAILDVSGSVAASVALPAGERVSFAGVPAGTYTLALRAVNGAGSSPSSAPLTITVPGACGGAPAVPANLLVYSVSGTTHVVWDPPASGEAATSYLVSASGLGAFPVAVRTISGALPAGTYTIGVQTVGACGTSAATTVTLTVP